MQITIDERGDNGMNLVKQMQMADSKTFNSYEYAIESISSSFLGETKKEEMLKVIQKYTNDGWRVHTIYSNELGKNAVSFLGVGVNSTQSEDIIIFERSIQYNVICHTERELLVMNYCEDLPVRFGKAKMIIPQNTDKFMFSIAGKYGKGISMEAFRVDADFITIFDEKISVKNISFITNNIEKSDFVTELYEIPLNKNEIRLIKAVKIYVKSYVVNGKAYSFENLSYIDVCNDNLSMVQKDIYGQDYFQTFSENDNEWRCVCGKINENSTDVCPICGRSRSNLKNNSTLDLTKIVIEIERKKSAKEIYNWLVDFNETLRNGVITKMTDELQKLVELERLYGNEKSTAVQIVKSYIDIVGNEK